MVEMFKSRLLEAAGFPLHGFTQRGGGVSEGELSSLNLSWDREPSAERVVENLRRVRTAIGARDPLARVRQVHGSDVIDAADLLAGGYDGWKQMPEREADAIVVAGTKALAGILTADCAAVLLADPSTRSVAAVHAGWRGAAKGVIKRAVRAISDRGATPSRLVAAIGPAICGRCYEVGEEVERRFPESSEEIANSPGKYLLDLPNAVEVSLIGAGLTTANIERIDVCTACHPELLFSHRASGGKCGHQLGFVSP